LKSENTTTANFGKFSAPCRPYIFKKILGMERIKDLEDLAIQTAPCFVIFWGTLSASQRLLGSLNYYSSRRWTFLVGVGVVGTCSAITHQLTALIHEYQGHPRLSTTELEYRTLLTVTIFALLERHAFQTAFPSSVITIGAYAKRKYFPQWARGSVISTSPTATPAQRFAVNRLGRSHGCHQCGSRQVVGWKSFIADHMPPTKMANEMNQVFWRRWLGLKVKQSLYPQCQSCFQLQGNAVRLNRHDLIYRFSPRLVHISPCLAIALSQHQQLRLLYQWLAEAVSEAEERWKEFFKS
jgi:hypothetical protein